MQYQIFFSIPFLILEIFKNAFSVESLHHKDSNMFRSLNKVEALFGGVSTWMGDQILIPRVVTPFFSPFFPFLFQSDRTAELPSLCNVVSSIYQLFVPHFAMTVFTCMCIC